MPGPAQALVSVSTIGTRPELDDEALAGAVQRELGAWFGAGDVASWQLLRVYRVPFAQPNQVRQLHALDFIKRDKAVCHLHHTAKNNMSLVNK